MKDQGHQAALLTAVLARLADVVRAWERVGRGKHATTLPSSRQRKALRRPRGRRGAGHIVAAARLQLVMPRP